MLASERGPRVQDVSAISRETKATLGAAEARDRSALSQILAQQAAVATLSQHALGEHDRDALLTEACRVVARVLSTELVGVLELAPHGDRLKLVAGVGWRPGMVGQRTVAAGTGSQSGFTIATGGPVIVEDLDEEHRFAVSSLLVEHEAMSGMTVRIGAPERPFGTIKAFTGRREQFTRDDARFLEAIAGVLASALARLEAETELRNSRDELAAIFASVSEGITVQDATGRLLFANDAAAHLTGLSTSAEMLGTPARDLVDRFELFDVDGSPFPQERLPSRVVLATGEAGPAEIIGFRPAGGNELRWSHVQSSPVVGAAGRLSRVVTVFRDVTDEHNAEQTREVFLGIMSHELRTPITTIYGGSELLAHGMDGVRRDEIIRDINSEAGRLARLVEDLLVMTRVERGVLEIGDEPLLLQRVLPAVIGSLSTTWPELKTELALEDYLPAVRGDATYIEQVVRNLIINAVRYGDALSNGVTVTAGVAGDEVQVHVLDRGPGLSGVQPDKLFELFYRSPSARAVSGGAGIGLYVCKAVIEAMGGRMWAQDRPEGGAEFGFSLLALEAD
jgi:signal transduction histidine kinase